MTLMQRLNLLQIRRQYCRRLHLCIVIHCLLLHERNVLLGAKIRGGMFENASVGQDVGLDEGGVEGGVKGKIVEKDIAAGAMEDVGVWNVGMEGEILVGIQ